MADPLILAAEDEPVDIMMIRRAFTKAGLTRTLRIIEDGDSVVDYLSGAGPYTSREEHPLPILILLDLKLPRRSGLEVLEWLFSSPGCAAYPSSC